MLRFLLILVLFFVVARTFWRLMDGVIDGATGGRRAQSRQVRPGTKLARDPVCGTYIVPNPTLSLTSGGSTHYFCSEGCRTKYRDPA